MPALARGTEGGLLSAAPLIFGENFANLCTILLPAEYRKAVLAAERLSNSAYLSHYGSLAKKPTVQSMLLFIQNLALKEIEKLRKELGYE